MSTTMYCECDDDWSPCGKSIELMQNVALGIIQQRLVLIVDGCPNGPGPTDQLVEERDGYKLYRRGETQMSDEVTFQWPKGTQAELEVYPEDHPQRKPTERYFANVVRRSIGKVRGGDYRGLWLMIESLKDLEDPQPQHSGFHSFYWAIAGVLGDDSCRKIGMRVCLEENFTLEEAEQLKEAYRLEEAEKYGLDETTDWVEIKKARKATMDKEMSRRRI